MGIPAGQKFRIGTYIIKQLLLGHKRFPFVLMIEPLFRCNLRCRGCGKIAHSEETLNRQLSIAECLTAAKECPAPVVSIAGGEPLLHTDISRIVQRLVAHKKFVYLCTNALLVADRIDEFQPSRYLAFNIHLDGLEERHDAMVGREGVFYRAVTTIRLLIKRGFRVTTNTTLYADESPESVARLFDFLTSISVEGMNVAPGFCHPDAPDQKNFLNRNKTRVLFRKLFEIGQGRKWRFNHSTLYLDFLSGRRNYECTPWGNPTRNIFGWQRPCYFINDGFAATYKELMDTTEWHRYGVGKDPRCTNCMVHCGFEPTAVMDMVARPWKMVFSRKHNRARLAKPSVSQSG
jgi:hopanoid biosynthesis associated radical SAM protein HpnH